jgi:hypothetical protein
VEEYHASHTFGVSDIHVRGILKLEHLPESMLGDEYIQMVVGAPKTSLERCFKRIVAEFGSINGYLDSIGCDAEWREELRSRMLVDN